MPREASRPTRMPQRKRHRLQLVALRLFIILIEQNIKILKIIDKFLEHFHKRGKRKENND